MKRALSACAVVLAVASAHAAPALRTYPAGNLIRWIWISEANVCSGQPTFVFVGTQHPTQPGSPVDVAVDGWPGTPQVVQHYGAGLRNVSVSAVGRRDQLTDARQVPLQVLDCPGTGSLDLLIHRNPFNRYRVDFRVEPKDLRATRLFRWYFGDGQTAVTREPFVSHDYAPGVRHRDPYSYFPALVQETASGVWSGKQIALASSYDLSRKLGFVQVDVDHALTKGGTGYVLGLKVQNRHDRPVVLDHYTKHYLPCDPAEPPRSEDVAAESVFGSGVAIAHPGRARTPGRVSLGKGGSAAGRTSLPFANLPPETCAIGFTLAGQSADRLPAYGSVYFTVRRNPGFTRPVRDRETRAALLSLTEDDSVASDQVVTGEDLYLLEQRGVVERTQEGWRRP